jgi:hypothetical protein
MKYRKLTPVIPDENNVVDTTTTLSISIKGVLRGKVQPSYIGVLPVKPAVQQFTKNVFHNCLGHSLVLAFVRGKCAVVNLG